MGALSFYFNDMYGNMGSVSTRSQTIPEAGDRQALGEQEKATNNAVITPQKQKHILIGLGVILAIVVVLGVGK